MAAPLRARTARMGRDIVSWSVLVAGGLAAGGAIAASARFVLGT